MTQFILINNQDGLSHFPQIGDGTKSTIFSGLPGRLNIIMKILYFIKNHKKNLREPLKVEKKCPKNTLQVLTSLLLL